MGAVFQKKHLGACCNNLRNNCVFKVYQHSGENVFLFCQAENKLIAQ